MAQLTFS